jgi:hypothetical protein
MRIDLTISTVERVQGSSDSRVGKDGGFNG